MVRRNNPEMKEAAALKYSPESDAAPLVVAVGRGAVADKILESGTENKVPIVRDPHLAHMLAKLSVGDDIPPELYTIVAQVLVFVGNMDGAYAKYKPEV